MKLYLALTAALLTASLLVWRLPTSRADIRNTKHNLSRGGPGPLKAAGEQRICVFCHMAHLPNDPQGGGAPPQVAPMWNRKDSGRTYIKYWSPTLDAYRPGEAPEVDGVSRLCLSCHDGTVALGEVRQGGLIQMRQGADRIQNTRGGRTGVDLSGSHPISFRVTRDLIARNNAKDMPLKPLDAMRSDPDVKLDDNGKIQCTTCHDVHNNQHGKSSGVPFYRKPTWEGVCLVCHVY